MFGWNCKKIMSSVISQSWRVFIFIAKFFLFHISETTHLVWYEEMRGIYLFIYIYIYMCVCVCVYVHPYISPQTIMPYLFPFNWSYARELVMRYLFCMGLNRNEMLVPFINMD